MFEKPTEALLFAAVVASIAALDPAYVAKVVGVQWGGVET